MNGIITFSEQTLDDLMRVVIQLLIAQGDRVTASRGSTREIRAVLLELRNPRARLSRTETRGKAISCIGELCWYLAGSSDLEFIEYYIPKYREDADGDRLHGAYGPRLINWDGINQIENVVAKLKEKPTSRKAVVQVFDRNDLVSAYRDVPCTCILQFMVRKEKLGMITYMRSNDAYLGLTHDVFCFSMLQEIIANSLSIDVGHYMHFVGSLHLYERDIESAKEFIGEGWQSTDMSMPQMPKEDPKGGVGRLLHFERCIRLGEEITEEDLINIHPYWADLVRLLQVFRSSKERDVEGIKRIKDALESEVYALYVAERISRLERSN